MITATWIVSPDFLLARFEVVGTSWLVIVRLHIFNSLGAFIVFFLLSKEYTCYPFFFLVL